MRSKTHPRITREEYEYNENRLSYDEHERSENLFHYGYGLTNKELIRYIDEELIYENEDIHEYTESDVPPNEFTFTENDIRVDENEKNIFTRMKMNKLLEVIVIAVKKLLY